MIKTLPCPHTIIRGYSLPPIIDTDLSYIAGIVDGEGTIGIWTCGYPSLSVVNTNLEVLVWIHSALGCGSINRKTAKSRRDCYTWRVSCMPEVFGVLTALRPYLRIKKERAGAVLGYLRPKLEIT